MQLTGKNHKLFIHSLLS